MASPQIEEKFVAIITVPRGLTLKKFIDLMDDPKKGNKIFFRHLWNGLKEIFEVPVEKTHTVAITKLLKNTRGLSFEKHQKILKEMGYEMPSIIHVIALAILTYTCSQEQPPTRLFQNTATSCSDYMKEWSFTPHTQVGYFRPPLRAPQALPGLVIDFRHENGNESIGVVAMKKF